MNRRAYRLGVVMAALTMAAAVLLRAFADAAYLSRFPDRLPWLFVGGAVATAAATLGYDRLRRHARTHAGIDLVLLGVLLVLAGLTPAGLAAGGQAPLLTTLVVLGLAAVANLAVWNCVCAAVAGRDARRALPRAGAAVTAGSALAGLLGPLLVRAAGAASVLPFIAAGLVVVVIALTIAQRRALASGGAPGAPPEPVGAPTPGLAPGPRALITVLVVAAALEAFVAAVVEVQFAAALRSRVQGDELASALALFYGVSSSVLLVAQALLVPRLLVSARLPLTVSLHPLGLLVALAGAIAAPGLAAVIGVRALDSLLRAATSRTGQEVSLSALPPAPRARWKVLLRGAATPVGTAAAGALLLAAGWSPIGQRATWLAVAAGLTVVWLLVVRAAAARFVQVLATPLGLAELAGAAGRATPLDLDEVRAAALAAGSAGDEGELGRARLHRIHARADDLLAHLTDPDAAVRLAVVELAAQAPAPALRLELAAAIACEDDDAVFARGLHALAALGDRSALPRARDRATVVARLGQAVRAAELHLGGGAGADDDARAWAELAGRDGSWAAAIARARPDLVAALPPGPLAREPAVAGLGSGRPALIAVVLAELDDPTRAPVVMAALADLGGDEARALAAGLDLHALTPPRRVALGRALAAAPTATSLLWRLADDEDAEVREVALRALGVHAEAGAVTSADRAPCERALGRALDELERIVATTGGRAARPPLRRALRAAALCAAATGRDPRPLVALLRRLLTDDRPTQARALDVVQEVAATSPRLLALIERWIRRPAPSEAAPAAAAASTEPGALAALLATTPVALDLPDRPLAALAAAATVRALTDGQVLFAQGEPGDAWYVVAAGGLRVEGTTSAPLGAGASVGELALIDAGPRSATVRAVGATLVVVVARAAFTSVLLRCPDAGLELARTIARWPARPVTTASA
ncbi:MAG: cyclic nucleotide-binding domain-containing protein [Kofleriaceae bacterium]|nr:cyclic nucleotide-binding domain-containing protein [Kofleriaceae bacterium]